jgi:pimeloyl-ACP methyl ester carboxylesterase
MRKEFPFRSGIILLLWPGLLTYVAGAFTTVSINLKQSALHAAVVPPQSNRENSNQLSEEPWWKIPANLWSPSTAQFTEEKGAVTLHTYQHNGYTLTYQYKAATRVEYRDQPPILLIHPVGIGMSSWFWKRFLSTWQGPAVYAVDLIGCGVSHGADAWNPEEQGMSFPLGWVKGCEALMEQVILRSHTKPFSLGKRYPTCTIMVQGGLAPVGVSLAFRNSQTVDRLILASPPSWKDMTTAVPGRELARNYNFLKSPRWGNLAFRFLETREAVEFFSNAFLFEKGCDAEWLNECVTEMGVAVRPPVQVFNAGFCMHRSYAEELESLSQPVLILQGRDDKARLSERALYETSIPTCRIETLPGKNVLPWESPDAVGLAVREFLGL